MAEATKRCTGCGKCKPVSAYYQRHGRPYQPCRACKKAAVVARDRRNAAEMARLRDTVAWLSGAVGWLVSVQQSTRNGSGPAAAPTAPGPAPEEVTP
jgi:hypothetical protein